MWLESSTLFFVLNRTGLGKECVSRILNILHIVLINVTKDNITSHYQGLTFLFTSVCSADIYKFSHFTEQEKKGKWKPIVIYDLLYSWCKYKRKYNVKNYTE